MATHCVEELSLKAEVEYESWEEKSERHWPPVPGSRPLTVVSLMLKMFW